MSGLTTLDKSILAHWELAWYPPYMGVFLAKMRFLRLNVEKSRRFPESLNFNVGKFRHSNEKEQEIIYA